MFFFVVNDICGSDEKIRVVPTGVEAMTIWLHSFFYIRMLFFPPRLNTFDFSVDVRLTIFLYCS